MDKTLIYESPNSLIYFQKESDWGVPVIIKMLKADYPSPKRIIQFNNEYEFTKGLSIKGVRKAFASDKIDNKYALILEYVDGGSLKDIYIGKNKSIQDFLGIASNMASSLDLIHRHGIIHKDITSNNILLNDTEVNIIDFGISSKIDLKSHHLGNPNNLEGTLEYFSPEQTGRMNRVVDYRTDLYSMGVVFYEMLTGVLPFESEDSLSLVHNILAKAPIPPHELNRHVPEVVSQIVMRLLSKNAEDRYQSALGLRFDLDLCAEYLENEKAIPPFKLGSKDYSGKFHIPQKLYGREEELSQLMEAFDRVSSGGMELFLVAGYSGVGKSALVNEVHKPITRQKGYFVSGKYDQYQRNIPYYAISQAFNEYCSYLLSEDVNKLDSIKNEILTAIGTLGHVLIEVIPHLELVLGPQPEVEKLEPMESIARFNLLFQKFIRAISKPERPLVVFIDDLQWADAASLNLIKVLVTDDKNQHLLILGAYRDNEVGPKHGLVAMLEEAKEEGAKINSITLQNLGFEHVKTLVMDALFCEDVYAVKIAELIFEKTGGNAFFTIEFLKSLYEQQLIVFDQQSLKWIAEIDKIKQREFSDNVVELMAGKISGLTQEAQNAIKYASCIGNQFNLHMLSIILNSTLNEGLAHLWNAIEEGMIIPHDENYRLVSEATEEEMRDKAIDFRFVHDRVQQAAYSLIEEDHRKETHLKIARLLAENLEGHEEEIFDIVNQFNEGLELVVSDEEKVSVGKLNLIAGKKSIESSAYGSALNYLRITHSLLLEDSWEKNYRSTLDTHKFLAEVEYLNGNFEASENITSVCLKNVTNKLDKADIYYILILQQSMASKNNEAIEEARKGLNMLGFDFPSENIEPLIQEEMGWIIQYFEANGIEGIYNHQDMSDPEKLATIKLLDNLSMPTYVSGQLNLWILHVLYKIHLSIEHGNTPETAYAFSEIGLIFCIQGLFKYGFPAGQLSRRLADKFEKVSLRHKARSLHLIANYINPWYVHITETDKINNQSYQASLDSGELIFAGYTVFHPFYNWFWHSGVHLDTLRERLPAALSFSKKIKHDLAHDSLLAMEMLIDNLQGKTEGPTVFTSKDYSEAAFLEHCQNNQNFYAISIFYDFKLSVLYIQEEFDAAFELLPRVLEFIPPQRGSAVNFGNFVYYQSLLLLAGLEDASEEKRAEYLEIVNANLEMLSAWAKNNKANFQHKYLLVEAEKCRVTQNSRGASNLYLDAINSAREYHYIREEALANELAGKYWIAKNNTFYARPHLFEARHGYERWGASAKVRQLETKFSQFLKSPGTPSKDSRTGTIYSTSHSGSHADNLDLISVVKASQALSGEIILERLLEKMMAIVIENAGAQKAVLLLEKNGAWFEEALKDENDLRVLQSISLNESNSFPRPLINYVIQSGEERIVLNPEEDDILAKDRYVDEHKPRSLMALPLFLKGKLHGVLYLENKLSEGAFTVDRIEILRLMSAQITVSIENARLYTDMSLLNTAYERFVPHEFIRTLGKGSILDVQLGDQIRQEMTILFTDIRSYTTLSEKMTPEENFNFINSYLNRVGPLIKSNNGFVNQFYGDGIMALFPGNPESAVSAAIEIQQAVAEYNDYRISLNREPIAVGVGIHTGSLMLGIIGDEKRHDTGVLSNAVNTASRIEGLTKLFSASIVISEDLLRKVDNPELYHYRFLGKVQVKGKEEAINVYEVYDGDSQEVINKKKETVSDFNEGLNHYFNREFIKAAASLKKVLRVNPVDTTAERYFKHAANFMVQGVDETWTGVEKLFEK